MMIHKFILKIKKSSSLDRAKSCKTVQESLKERGMYFKVDIIEK